MGPVAVPPPPDAAAVGARGHGGARGGAHMPPGLPQGGDMLVDGEMLEALQEQLLLAQERGQLLPGRAAGPQVGSSFVCLCSVTCHGFCQHWPGLAVVGLLM
jgi:hypothetical protein